MSSVQDPREFSFQYIFRIPERVFFRITGRFWIYSEISEFFSGSIERFLSFVHYTKEISEFYLGSVERFLYFIRDLQRNF